MRPKLGSVIGIFALIALQFVLSNSARAQFYSGGVFTLTCKTGGMNLDNQGSTGPGSHVWQWSANSTSPNQQWRIKSIGNGYYSLVCVKSGMALDNAETNSNGISVNENYPNGSTNQQWSITSVGGGYYQLVCAASGKALDNSGSASNGGTVWQWDSIPTNTNQQWLITPVQTGPTPLLFNLTCKTSSMNLDSEGSFSPGSTCWQWSGGAGSTNQEWQFNNLGNGYYQITNTSNGLALDSGGGTANGSYVVQNYSSSGSTNQQWALINVGGTYYQIVNRANGLALDNSGSTGYGAKTWQWTPTSGTPNQQWLITPVQIGANTPFTEFEAESGSLAGGANVLSLTAPPTTMFSSPQLEASGHSYVNLPATGSSVSWTNNTGKTINFIDIRYSIPDAPSGGGITSTIDLYVNGAFRQALPVNSKQTWEYESTSWYDGMSKTPTPYPHVFWDEVHAFISGAGCLPGQTVTIQKDAANSASYYNIDVVDLEAPPAPISQPANTLSITSFGAVANNSGADSTTAIQNCINAAQSSGQAVWIPQGTYYINNPYGLSATGITIEGAGMWYSTIFYNPALPASFTNNVIQPTSCTLQNFEIDGDAIGNQVSQGCCYAANVKGSNWVLNSLWVHHEGPIWADGTNGIVQNCRINNSWADGLNLNNGSGSAGNNTGNNLTAYNNFVRGTGDDALALNCQNAPGAQEMENVSFINNTTVAPWWANNMGVYGGENCIIANNYFHDSVKEFGVSIGLYGGTAYMNNSCIQGNTLVNCGSNGYGQQFGAIAVGQTSTASNVTNVYIDGNLDINAMFDGIDFENGGSNLLLFNNSVISPGRTGIAVNSGMAGSATLTNDTVKGLASGQSAYIDNAPRSQFSIGGSNDNGFVP